MRLVVCVVLSGVMSGVAFGAVGQRIASHGVQVVVPPGWQQVRPGSDAPVTDPRTLLVVGTHGRKGFSHLLLGSVAEKVVRRSEVPVLTVRSSK